ncbi:MAG: hypothetical protein KAY24_09040 [Candidatus Eisenbacteria sp.]|nr:hypothetical protein [Candidatus Eisenbacteria bacterium]
MRSRKKLAVLAACLGLIVCVVACGVAGENKDTSFFSKSLHATGEGMRYWYEEQGGFMKLTGIPYDKLGCKNCHVKSCDQCHAEKSGDEMVFSGAMSHQSDTCLKCHSRAKGTFAIDKANQCLDVHMAAGFTCSRCHRGHDVHGDGKAYQSMRSPGAVEADCQNCHTPEATDSPAYESSLTAHSVHDDKLDCSACHVQSTFACYNCHFSKFLETKTKKGNFIKTKDWLLLVNYEGKVTAGTAMTLVHNDKTFIGYGPYYTHSVGKGRKCESCHANPAVTKINSGGKFVVSKFEDGKVVFSKGVVPAVPEKLEWVFLDKKGDDWVPLKDAAKPLIQWIEYGSPLTTDQIEKMAEPYESD